MPEQLTYRAIEDADQGLGSYAPARVTWDDDAELRASACRALCPTEAGQPGASDRAASESGFFRAWLLNTLGVLVAAAIFIALFSLIEGWHR